MGKTGSNAESLMPGVEPAVTDALRLRRDLQKLRKMGVSDLAMRPAVYPALYGVVAAKTAQMPDDALDRLEVCRAVFKEAIGLLPSSNLQSAASILFHLDSSSEAPSLDERRRSADRAYAGRDVVRSPDTIQRTLERDLLDPLLLEIFPRLPPLKAKAPSAVAVPAAATAVEEPTVVTRCGIPSELQTWTLTRLLAEPVTNDATCLTNDGVSLNVVETTPYRSSESLEDTEEATKRRDALQGLFATAALTTIRIPQLEFTLSAAAGFAEEVSRRAADATPEPFAVDVLEDHVMSVVENYPRVPHSALAPKVAELWRRAESALEYRMPLRVRSRVVHAAGFLAYYLGRLSFNLGCDTAAMSMCELAARHADDIGDPMLRTSIANLRSSVAYWQKRYPAALDYLLEVQMIAPHHLAARVHAYQARTYAAMGNGPAAMDALSRMDSLSGCYGASPGSTPVGPAGAALFRAGVASRLGDAAQAERFSRLAIEAYGSERSSAEYNLEEERHASLTLAKSLVERSQPELDEVASLLMNVAQDTANSPSRTLFTKANQLWTGLTPDQRRSSAASPLAEAIAQLGTLPSS